MKLKVFTDYACPFCYIGYRLAEKVASELNIEVEYYFSEIHPEVPESGCATSDIVKGELTGFNSHIARLAEPYGIKPQLGGKISNSKKAIILRGFVNDKYPEIVGEFDEAVYKAYLIDNLDIGDNNVLVTIMNSVGITENVDIALNNTMANIKFELDRSTAKENYVDSIPTFVVDGKRLEGAVSPSELREFIVKSLKL
jgi:predicted DsbA family dithiol-disulfide isomerase